MPIANNQNLDLEDLLLEVENLNVTFHSNLKDTEAVKGASFKLFRGQSLGIVGESGSGKSVTSLSVLKLLGNGASCSTSGNISFYGSSGVQQIFALPEKKLYEIRGRKISMVFQEPMSALNPVRKCGAQAKEILDVHNIGPPNKRRDVILGLFKKVALKEVERIYESYPHELSGGQLQRVNIAMALAPQPDIIICDEPTTALDVTIQKQIIDLLKVLIKETGISLIFISHDLDVVANLCDNVVVMYRGEIVESGILPDTFTKPEHPYTRALLQCKPNAKNQDIVLPTVTDMTEGAYIEKKRPLADVKSQNVILSVENLKVFFPKTKVKFLGPKEYVKAVNDVSFSIYQKEIFGIVGESGSGKSTIANCLAGLINPSSGIMKFNNVEITPEILSNNKILRTKIQLVFQDPYSSLNPKMSIGQAILEPIKYHRIVEKKDALKAVIKLLNQVGLDENFLSRYPHQLSGGQRQRVCIARALSVNPEVLICDESVSALDVSVQAQILNLLDRLRAELDLTMVFISHDLSVIRYLCDRVLVMKDGKIVEQGTPQKIMSQPQEEYTQRLVNSIPEQVI